MREQILHHETALHGHDHWRWIHNAARWNLPRAKTELRRGWESFVTSVGRRPTGFGAPGWQATDATLKAVDSFDFSFASDCRGMHPFVPEGYRTVQLPTTLPSLEEALRSGNKTYRHLFRNMDALLQRSWYHCYCMHCETEGLRSSDFLPHLLAWADSRGLRCGPLGDVLTRMDRVPAGRIVSAPFPGRTDRVATQVQP